MSYTEIKVNDEWEGQVRRVTLAAPKANVLGGTMMIEITRAVTELKDRPQCKLLILDHEGKHFSFGASVPEHVKDQAPGMLKTFNLLFDTLMDTSLPILSVVRGQCLGGALELACFAQFVFADTSAFFGVPEIKLAVFPPPASAYLPMKIGQTYSDELILTGASWPAQEAKEKGLITKVFEPDKLQEGIELFVKENIVPKSASSLRFATRAARWKFNAAFAETSEALTRLYLEELMVTKDANEGIEAFLGKRDPVWQDQ